MASDLKPCPFCGSGDLVVTELTIHRVRCQFCGVGGPDGVTEAEAIMYWNRRTREPEREPDEIVDEDVVDDLCIMLHRIGAVEGEPQDALYPRAPKGLGEALLRELRHGLYLGRPVRAVQPEEESDGE